LKRSYWEIYEHRTNPRREYEEQQVSKVHIVFDLSRRGALKVALRDDLAVEGEKVIAISDTFSVGPFGDYIRKKV